MRKPKLILLYGFASSGKTTISKKYLDEHPLAMSIEGDQIISMMGQWRKHWEEAREMVHEYTVGIVKAHLSKGHDVLLPYLLINGKHAEDFEAIAKNMSANFSEVYINIERTKAIERLLQRGVWGEEGSPQLTEEDLPEINELYDAMEKAMATRNNLKNITSNSGDVDGTYSKFLSSIS